MEDRKRPAVGGADELAPPSKRVAVNGSKAKDEALEMKEEGWVEVRVARSRLLFVATPTHLAIATIALEFLQIELSQSASMVDIRWPGARCRYLAKAAARLPESPHHHIYPLDCKHALLTQNYPHHG